MRKKLLREVVTETNNAVLIGIGPMSANLIEAAFLAGKEDRFPLMFIASRNQIDLKELGGGYVQGWDQFDFAENIRKVAEKYDFPHYYLCRDHGGPWQRDEERQAHLPVEEAVAIAQKSSAADIEAGFDLIMVDPTKDPFTQGKTVPMDFVLKYTVELIEFCEKRRQELGVGEISYEVGTEETNGGLTTTEEYDVFLQKLRAELTAKGLPMPLYAVGQTGTLVKETHQAGRFDYTVARQLAQMAGEYGVYLKEHNGDYLDHASLLAHIPAGVSAVNVAPEFGYVETMSWLELCQLAEKIGVDTQLREVMLERAVATKRWQKWVETEVSADEVMAQPELSERILKIAGHYTLSETEVDAEIRKLCDQLKKRGVKAEEFAQGRLVAAVRNYVNCLGLKGSLK